MPYNGFPGEMFKAYSWILFLSSEALKMFESEHFPYDTSTNIKQCFETATGNKAIAKNFLLCGCACHLYILESKENWRKI